MSAEKAVNYIFKSWFTLQSRLQQRLSGKQKWLDILKSDEQLSESCGCDVKRIKEKAAQVLKQVEQTTEQDETEQNQGSVNRDIIRQKLFKLYGSTKQPLSHCAIAYLLKNGGRLPTKAEDPEKFMRRRRKAEIQVQQFQDQIEGRIPKGRDLAGQAWLDTLELATIAVPKDNREHKQWQDRLLTDSATAPFPILFETNEDLTWSMNDKDRLCVHFNGLSEHRFQIYCDNRQLSWFKRFLEDQETK